MRRFLLVIAAAVIIALIIFVARSDYFLPDGKTLFIEQGCVRCHTFRGVGNGPVNISNVSEKWSNERLRDQIRNPSTNNPETGMPNFGYLSRRQVNALIKFLNGRD